MPEARGSTPRGRTHHHGGIAERLSHTQQAECSAHTPVTHGTEVVTLNGQTALRARELYLRPRRPIIVFPLHSDARELLRRVAQSGQRERFGTARSELSQESSLADSFFAWWGNW